MLDNIEMNQILEKLESLEDEKLAVMLLKQLNDLTSKHGKLILNYDPSFTHDEWKKQSDLLKKEIDALILKINEL